MRQGLLDRKCQAKLHLAEKLDLFIAEELVRTCQISEPFGKLSLSTWTVA